MTGKWLRGLAAALALALMAGTADAAVVSFNFHSSDLGAYVQTRTGCTDYYGNCVTDETSTEISGVLNGFFRVDTALLPAQGGDPAGAGNPSTAYSGGLFATGGATQTGGPQGYASGDIAGASSIYAYIQAGGGISPAQFDVQSTTDQLFYDDDGLLIRRVIESRNFSAFINGVTGFDSIDGAALPRFGPDRSNSSFGYSKQRVEIVYAGGVFQYYNDRYESVYANTLEFDADAGDVPEPAALGLLGLGMLGVALRRRRALPAA